MGATVLPISVDGLRFVLPRRAEPADQGKVGRIRDSEKFSGIFTPVLTTF